MPLATPGHMGLPSLSCGAGCDGPAVGDHLARETMAALVDAATLKAWLSDGAEIALLDVREQGEFGWSHLFFAVPLPYSRFELALPALVPNAGVRLVLCDADGSVTGVAARAARRAE